MNIFFRYEEAKERSVVSYFFELFRLSRDYEIKVKTNPWTFLWYMVLWRMNGANKPAGDAEDGSADRKSTWPRKLFEFVEFVTNRKKPKAQRPPNSEEDLIHKLNGFLASSNDFLNDDEYVSIKNELKKAIHLKIQRTWEEQRVQVTKSILIFDAHFLNFSYFVLKQ